MVLGAVVAHSGNHTERHQQQRRCARHSSQPAPTGAHDAAVNRLLCDRKVGVGAGAGAQPATKVRIVELAHDVCPLMMCALRVGRAVDCGPGGDET